MEELLVASHTSDPMRYISELGSLIAILRDHLSEFDAVKLLAMKRLEVARKMNEEGHQHLENNFLSQIIDEIGSVEIEE